MKKLLPKTINNPHGFTLVELLVVITIIAILSVIGMAVFTNVQKNARDARRRADVNALVNALEANKLATGYVVLSGSQFASGSIPTTDPQSNPYCAGVSTLENLTIKDCSAPTGYAAVSVTNPAAGAASWKICAYLENPAGAFCKTSAQ